MALNFPNEGLYVGYQYTGDNGVVYIYDGVKWVGHSPTLSPGTSSLINGSNVVQVDGDGNLVIPTGSTIKFEDGSSYANTGTSWTAVPDQEGCPIYAELTPNHFKAYTQKSHIDLYNNGDWEIGSQNLGHYIRSRPTLDGNDSINIHNLDYDWNFGSDGILTLPNQSTILSIDVGFNQNFSTNGAGGYSINEHSLTVGIANPDWVTAITSNPSNYYITFDAFPGNYSITGISGPQGGTNIYTLTGTWPADGGGFPITITSNDYDSNVTALASIGGAVIATAEGTWHFGSNGELYLPQGGRIGGTKGGTMLDAGNGYNTSLTSYYPSGMFSSCVTANADGTLSIRAYGDGTGLGGEWTFSTDGNLTLPSGGIIKNYDGSTYGGGSGDFDGGAADNTAGITITSYTLQTDLSLYDVSGSITYNIRDAGATEAGIIFKGLTIDYTQTITGDFNQGDNTVDWTYISGQLWEQVVSVTAYVVDSRGYTFYAIVRDMYDVPHGPCLVEGTLITMADGTHKAIEDITHGELIRVWNFDLGEFGEAQPIWIKIAEETTEHDVYTFSDGTQLRTVGHHVFNKEAGAFTKLKLAETPVGTTTFNEHGEEVTLVSKQRVTEPTRYYNVWTQYHLNLFANGILTSNRFNNIYPIVDMKFIKDNRALRSVDEFADIDEKYITGLRLQEQEYSLEYIQDYVHNRLERLDINNQVEQGI